MKVMLGELTDKSTQGRAFAMFGVRMHIYSCPSPLFFPLHLVHVLTLLLGFLFIDSI